MQSIKCFWKTNLRLKIESEAEYTANRNTNNIVTTNIHICNECLPSTSYCHSCIQIPDRELFYLVWLS